MRSVRLLWVSTLAVLLAVAVTAHARPHGAAAPQAAGAQTPAAPPLTMSIAAFADGTDIPAKYTQAGNQTSPAISWMNTPPGTVTFLLHMHDMELARNHTTDDQVHWLVWNIPGSATGLPEGIPMGQLQNGALQLSVSGPVYRGPGAPANGPRHHYTFELFALDTKLDVQPGSDAFATRAEDFMKAIQGHILGKAVYVGLFHRPQ